MRRFKRYILIILTAVLLLGTAFTAAEAVPQAEDDPDEWFLSYLREQIVPSFEESGLNALHERYYPQIVSDRDVFAAFAFQIAENGANMSAFIQRQAESKYPQAKAYSVELALSLDWKMLGTLLFIYRERIIDVLRQNLTVAFEMIADETCTAAVGFSDFDTMLWLDNETDWFAARNSYYYLNTVYDDNGEERRQSAYRMSKEKLDSLSFPLDAKWYTRIKTTWFRSRDGGRRKHTGMDIRCAHSSPVYACAGGIVNSVGYHVKGGYYVSVVDDDGYEYFYYHLKKDSQIVVRGQRVTAGEQLGLSGNTGNSAAPHLHLSVVAPERRFVDPFHIYYRWVYDRTGMLVKKPS